MQINRRFKTIEAPIHTKPDTGLMCSHCGDSVPERHASLTNQYGQKERFCSISCQQERRRSMADEMR